MAAALALLLMGCLVQGSMSREFKVTMPETMSVLSGSCVTIPCGFDIESQYDENFDETCRAMWKAKDSVVFDSSTPQQSKIKGTFQGNLQSKNCTTTLNSMEPQHGNEYVFRLECNNRLKWIYRQQILNISVKDEPPTLTLSPTTLEVTEGTTVRLTCSAPAPCRSHPPALSWSPRVGEGQETLQVNPDKTEFKMSVVNFRASILDHGQNISCTAVYPKQKGSEVSVSAELTARVLFAPQILASSDCTKSAQQLNCSCETVGNPAPTLQWLLNGESVNQSDGFTISTERLNATSLRSVISVSDLQRTDLSTLLCHSSNSQGSATQRFYIYSSMSREFKVTMPETMSVLSGSCVTIPCGFDIKSEYDRDLDGSCHAVWKVLEDTVVFDSSDPQQSEIEGTFQGNLQSKNCTTTLNSMEPQHGNEYVFRLECNNRLKWIYRQQILKISVKDEPPSLTLSPTTLEVTEGTTVRLTCSAPAPCPSHPPALSWSPRVGEAQETLQVNPDKTEFKMSVVNFRASILDHGQSISCTAVYPKQNGSEVSMSAELTARVLFAPQILASSDCTKSAQQLNCSCETVGNPAPTLQWLLNGESVNQSDGFSISIERLNATSLRSVISVSEPQRTDLSTLLCHSSNSQRSATQRFYIYSLKPQAAAGMITLPVFITTVGILLLIPCVLLLVIRMQKTHCSGHGSATTEPDCRLSVLEDNTYENVNVLTEAHATYHRSARGQRTGPAFKR